MRRGAGGTELAGLLQRAMDRRRALLEDPQVEGIRVFHGEFDGLSGLVVEQFGGVLVVQRHEGELKISDDEFRRLCAESMKLTRATAVYVKTFPKERGVRRPDLEAAHRERQPLMGDPADEEFPIGENGIRFNVRPFDGYAVGLFLDQRENRARVREMSAGRRVLNGFAYTCGFSVAAALSGAATVSVDTSKRYLEWGKRNFAATGLGLDDHMFICSDMRDYYARARRQGRAFDMVILDPPSFGRAGRKNRPFSLKQELDAIVAQAIDLLDDQGVLLLCSNLRGLSVGRLETAVAAAERSYEKIARPGLPADFAGDVDYAKSIMVRVGRRR
jgi:23S rRNA (cytosine1962-C5)-methyltransferase